MAGRRWSRKIKVTNPRRNLCCRTWVSDWEDVVGSSWLSRGRGAEKLRAGRLLLIKSKVSVRHLVLGGKFRASEKGSKITSVEEMVCWVGEGSLGSEGHREEKKTKDRAGKGKKGTAREGTRTEQLKREENERQGHRSPGREEGCSDRVSKVNLGYPKTQGL
jgi:hypothetical protein